MRVIVTERPAFLTQKTIEDVKFKDGIEVGAANDAPQPEVAAA